MRSILCLSLLLAVTAFAHAQWSIVYTDSAGLQFRDLQFISSSQGFALGDDGSTAWLLRTTDAGATWDKLPLPASYADRVIFRDSLHGHVMQGGAPVRLMSTTDGGATWTAQPLDSSFLTVGFAMPKDDLGYYFNNEGRFRKWKLTAGVASFSYLGDTLQDGTNLLFTDSLHGYSPQAYYLHHSADGGLSWNARSTGLPQHLYGPAFCFSSPVLGLAGTVGTSLPDGKIWRTTDEGMTWTLSHDFGAATLHVQGGIALAVDDSCTAAISMDGGITWWEEPLGVLDIPSEQFVAEVSPGGELFLITGYEGKILKRTTPLGRTPTQREATLIAFPNPAQDMLHIGGILPEEEWTLHSLMGAQVLQGRGCGTADLRPLASGCYLLRAGTACLRVLVQ